MIIGDGPNNQIGEGQPTSTEAPSPAPAVSPAGGGGDATPIAKGGGSPATVIKRGMGAPKESATPPAAEPPAYNPNYKFKVLDKEHEFDDFVKAAVKDQETEKKARELYERAYGLDSVKQDRQTLKGELSSAKEKMARTDQALETLGEYVRGGDFDSFFEALNIPKHNILKYALELVQREQMPPEQKAQWQQSREATMHARTLEAQNQQLESQFQQMQVERRTFELDTAISRPEIAAVVQAYDAGIGSPGAFRDFVIRIGNAAHAAQGVDLSAAQAVEEAMRHLRAVNPSLGQPQAQPQMVANGGPQVVMPNQKPVIPNIQGRGTSAVKSSFTSFADLKKRGEELERQGG